MADSANRLEGALRGAHSPMRKDEVTAWVIDDHETFRAGVAVLLRSMGVRPIEIGTADEFLRALSAASESTAAPDLIVLDLYLPWGDTALLAENRLAGALACLERLKTTAATRAIPVVILSAFAQDDLVKEQLRPYQPAAMIGKDEPVARFRVVVDNLLPNRPRRIRDVVRRVGSGGEHQLLRIGALIGAVTGILTVIGVLVRWVF